MTFSLIFWSIAAVAMLIVLPVVMIRGMVDHFRTRPSERRGSGGISAGIGAALHELDRIIARPSVEHHVDTEQRVLKREDDQGGE
ncbi:MAG TPA: hypothetical protein VH107_20970 [Lacipirellulaceae bacterium]|jgi:hypothetical protein|nr:hypothetical protein [Lacipirellulaceae bacterium]